MSCILWPGGGHDQPGLGGKARALAGLQCARLPIPPWFVVAPQAFWESAGTAEICRDGDASEMFAAMAPVAVSEPIKVELEQALDRLGADAQFFAVRSSASDEDGPAHSYAGQLDSYLFVRRPEVAARIAAVWRSGFSERILAYRREHGLSGAPSPPSVLVQRMVAADVAGVAFSADPVSGRRQIAVVSAVLGLGTGLVSGECDADTYQIDRRGAIIARSIANKSSAHRAAPDEQEGVRSELVDAALATKPCLTDDQVKAVALLARQAAGHFERPQDIEWAFEDGRLFLLQSRPITSLTQLPDPDEPEEIWDNSNIVESYSDVTTPLTFSFARHAYAGVYREFCRLMRVPRATIEANEGLFRCMLGLVRGRVYYNLINWYRLIALLPGFQSNRHFMEQMMGVKEALPESIAARLQNGGTSRFLDRIRLLRAGWGLLINHFQLPRQIRRFYERLAVALAPPHPPLPDQLLHELAASYRDLERRLLTRWDAPIVNDFFAMIYFGLARRLATKWCQDSAGTLPNDLLCGEGGIVSAEPAQRVRQMAEIAAREPEMVDALCAEPLEVLLVRVEQSGPLGAQYRAYLERFGDRCLEELKLESQTLHDDPTALLRSIGQFARRLQKANGGVQGGVDALLRKRAEGRVKQTLAGHPLRRAMFSWVVKHMRARVRDRENLRFERTRLFGRVRRIFLEIGRRLYALGRIDAARDVFYLEVEELLSFLDGTATTADLRGMISVRQAEFAAYRQASPPDERFQVHGSVHLAGVLRRPVQSSGQALSAGQERRGLGCCPGIVRGPVRVIRDPRGAVLHAGEILVAERTDPGWITLFPAATGLLVERGSLLSHSAIVARELGIPAVVSITGLTHWLADGDQVELNGSSGIVRRLDSAPPTAEEKP